VYVGGDPNYRLPLRIITDTAWQSLFARNMFLPISDSCELKRFVPEFTLIASPKFRVDPRVDGTLSETAIAIDFSKRLAVVANSSYGGEVKKSIFTVLNYLMPLREVMSMHCSSNVGKKGDVALFFGLSGTGKTTLSADPDRKLIGDDEHGWSNDGVFNYEGGCYAKVIRLSEENEPEIYAGLVPTGIYSQCSGQQNGKITSPEYHFSDSRCPGCSASDCPFRPKPGYLPLYQRVYLQNRRYRTGLGN
jgi:phosphoenolpyruvate carboxykinase (ATP)